MFRKIHIFLCLFPRLFIFSCRFFLLICALIFVSGYLSIYLLTFYLLIYHLYIYVCLYISIQLSIHLFIYSSMCLFIYSFIHSICVSVIHPCIHSTTFFLFAFLTFNPCFTAWVCHGVFTACFLLLIYITYALS